MRSTSNAATLAAAVIISLFLQPVAAFWRMPCPGRLVLERADPIISPGAVSGHVHTVSGGSGFSFTTSYEQLRASKCSSCPIQQDLSAYWTPKLYWRNAANTRFVDVPQAGEGNGATGGMTIYYEQRATYPNTTLKAFPPGLRMVAGNPFQRNYTGAIGAPGLAVQFVCLDYSESDIERVDQLDRHTNSGKLASLRRQRASLTRTAPMAFALRSISRPAGTACTTILQIMSLIWHILSSITTTGMSRDYIKPRIQPQPQLTFMQCLSG